jgi:hypothetical protein
MGLETVLAAIDLEIAMLNEAKHLLTARAGGIKSSRRRRRPLSAEGRARIVAAQKARWAKIHKASAK